MRDLHAPRDPALRRRFVERKVAHVDVQLSEYSSHRVDSDDKRVSRVRAHSTAR